MATILFFPRSVDDLQNRPPLTAVSDRIGFTIRNADVNIPPQGAAELIEFWHPDGCLVNNDRLPASLFAGIPTLFTHRAPADPGAERHCYLTFNEERTSSLAARELLSSTPTSCAYVPPIVDEYWSQERERAFVHLVGLNGMGVSVLRWPTRRISTLKRQRHLSDWLKGLPRPIGLFACNDGMAVDVLAACAIGGLSVPDDVAVLGVDNQESICESLHPTLSSIGFNFHGYYSTVFGVLSKLLRGDKPMPTCTVLVEPLGVVRRASTLRLQRTDRSVLAACDFIRREACSGIGVDDVVTLFPCGRRMAEIRFRAAMGHTILEEIRAIRRAHAEELAACTNLTRDAIASACGYASRTSLLRLMGAAPLGRG